MSQRIVSIGECMVEMSPTDDPGTYRRGFAGDTFNTAWYLSKLRPAWRVEYLTDAGRDGLSDAFLAMASGAGIGTARVRRRDDATLGLYLVDLTDGERSFTYWRGRSAARGLADDPARLHADLDGADLIYLSGITLGILPATGRATLMRATDTARSHGAQIAFDPNLRPALWPDHRTMCDAVTEMAGRSDIVLPSHEDEARFFGDADPLATLSRYRRDGGAEEVVVKNGGGPIHAIADGAEIRADPKPVADVVDSTAAGDSFNAAYIAERLSGASVRDAVDAAANLAAIVVSGRGALVDPGSHGIG